MFLLGEEQGVRTQPRVWSLLDSSVCVGHARRRWRQEGLGGHSLELAGERRTLPRLGWWEELIHERENRHLATEHRAAQLSEELLIAALLLDRTTIRINETAVP